VEVGSPTPKAGLALLPGGEEKTLYLVPNEVAGIVVKLGGV
jgi:hypothetical protein